LNALGFERAQMIQPRRYRDVHIHWQRNGRHPIPKIKKPGDLSSPGFDLFVVRSLGWFVLLTRDRMRGDLEGPPTTTGAGAQAAVRGHGTQILASDRPRSQFS
jgi:hypothetical protein